LIRTLPIAALLGACASPLGGEDIDLGVGASALPGLGVTVSASQRMTSTENARIDVEFGWTHQELDDHPDGTDEDWEQVQLGLLWEKDPLEAQHWIARAGVVWLRAQGDPVYLDDPGDYGGVYLGVGYRWETSPHLSTGPDFSLLLVDGEGRQCGGVVPQLAWRLVWHL